MAYLEIRQKGKLIKRQNISVDKAKSGLTIRVGSLGKVFVKLGEPATLGDYEIIILEEPLPENETDEKQESFPTISGDQISIPKEENIPSQSYPQIEGYKIIDRLGKGGMGTVWRAEQLSTKRQVALKLMVSHVIDSQRAQARFQREVELTARFDHPNIARIYDSGLHQGMYYYAMELIDGLALDKYVKDYRLTQKQILILMRKICQAVLYAHLRGVIHRDLKPSNILVDSEGQPHVLDFGLAKALLEEESIAISMEGQIAGTPAYMSPEQASGLHSDLDTRTDVFSLGVILYELLTGRSPHDLSGSALDVLHNITEGNIRRPTKINKKIDSELEAIILKALSVDPEKRYASAGMLGMDISSYLEGEPLNALVPTTLYFLRKKAFKYKKQVAITAVVLFVIFLSIFAAYTKVIGERAVTLAMQERNKLLESELADLRTKILSGNAEEAEAALSALEEKYLTAQKTEQETVISNVMTDFLTNDILGSIRIRVWEGNQDTTLLLGALYAIRDRLEYKFEDAPLTEAIIRKSLGNTFQTVGELKVAEQQLKRAIDIYQEQLGEEDPITLDCMDNLASLYEEQGNYGEAEQLFIEVLDIKQRLLGEVHTNILEYMEKIASFYRIHEVENRFDKLGSLYAKMLEIRRQIFGEEHSDTLESISNLGWVYLMRDLYEKAEPLLLEAVQASRSALGEQHLSTIYSLNNLKSLISKLGMKGIEEYQAGMYEEALGTLRKAYNLSQNVIGQYSPVDIAYISMALYQLDRVEEAKTTLNNLRSLMENPKFDIDQQAQNSLREAEQLFAGENSRLYLAWKYVETAELEQASKLVNELRLSSNQEDSEITLRLQSLIKGLTKAYYNRGRICEYINGQYQEAISNYEAALRIDPNYALDLGDLAWLQATCPVPDFRDGTKAISNATKACQLTDWTSCNQINTLAAAYAEAGDFAAAIEWQSKAIDLLSERERAVWRANYESLMELYKSNRPYHRVKEKTDSIVGRWEFEGNAMDSSSNHYHGIEVGNATYTDGVRNRALALHGNGDYILVPTLGQSLEGLDALAISLWIKPNTTETDSGFMIFGDPHGADWRGIRYDKDGVEGGGTNDIKVAVTTTGECQQLESSSNVQTLEWQHIAVTWTSGNDVVLYIDGKPNAPTWRHQARTGTLAGWTKMLVGKGSQETSDRGSWRGLIDDVRIYDRALSEGEVMGIYLGDAPGPPND